MINIKSLRDRFNSRLNIFEKRSWVVFFIRRKYLEWNIKSVNRSENIKEVKRYRESVEKLVKLEF